MDRRFDSDRAAMERDRLGRREAMEPVLPSRLDARASCLRALHQKRGLVLVTGESGSGKTWLWRHLAGSTPELGRWLSVDVAPSDSGLELVRRALRGLGRSDATSVVDPRSELADELAEQAEDGRRWILVLDEAQNASDSVLEEFRLLSNRLGLPDGFSGLLLVGRTGLVLRLRGRAYESLESRLAVHVRLGPIDAEEARTLLEPIGLGRSLTDQAIETLLARAAGNPARFLRLADRAASASRNDPRTASVPLTPSAAPSAPPARRPSPIASRTTMEARPGEERLAESPRLATAPRWLEPRPEPDADGPCCDPPRLGESRPPLRFEDGVIEVGWVDSEDAPVEVSETLNKGLFLDDFAEESLPPEPIIPSTVMIDDPYAAIEARSQWSKAVEAAHLGLGVEARPGDEAGSDGLPLDPADPCDCDRLGSSNLEPTARPASQVRAESGQEFAPYSRLFSQVNSTNETDS